MMKNGDYLATMAAALREKAEGRLLDHPDISCSPSEEWYTETRRELELHQIELELQNNQLLHTQLLLDKSLKRYFDLYDLAPVGYCLVSEAGLLLEANSTLAALLGTSANTLVDQSIYKFINDEDKDQFYFLTKRASANLAAENNELCSCTLRLLRSNQALCWVELNSTSIVGEDGKAVLHIAVTDITAAKLAKIAVQRQTELLDLTGEMAKVGGWEVNLETMRQSWTRETFRIIEIDSLIEPPVEDGINLFAPEARPTIAAAVQAAIETGTPYDLELPLITAKGRRLWVQTKGFAEMVNGKAIRIYGTFKDITARKQAEVYHANVMDSVSDHIAVLDDQGVILSVNLAWKKFAIENNAPRLADHSVGLSYLAACAESLGFPEGDDASSVCSGLRSVLAGELDQFEMEYLCHTPEEQRWFLLTITRLTGAKPGAVIAHKNISGRRLAELKNEESEARLAAIVNSSMDAIIAVDINQNILLFNPAAEDMFRISASEVIGQSLDRFIPARFAHHHRHHVERFATSSVPSRAMTVGTGIVGLRANLEEFPIEAAISQNRIGPTQFFTVVLRDLTESMRAEAEQLDLQAEVVTQRAELIQTLNRMSDAVITVDLSGKLLTLNPATSDLFGYPLEALMGQNISMLLPSEVIAGTGFFTQDPSISGVSGKATTNLTSQSREVTCLHKSGRAIPITLNLAPIFNDYGKCKSYVVVFHDLTEIKKQQMQLIQIEKGNAVGKLTSGIAHDFNNIIGIVRGYAEMLTGLSDATAQRYARSIIAASDRASNLTTRLLNFQSSKKYEKTQLDLNQLIVRMTDMLTEALSKGVTLQLNFCSQPTGVELDVDGFEHALINMAINARHAMCSKGSFAISTDVCKVAKNDFACPNIAPGFYVKVSLRDTGKGMTEEVKNKIFEPFFTTKGEDGTGLGLAQVFNFVNGCEGFIDVQSEVGVGSNFTLYFPFVALASETEILPIELTQSRDCVNGKGCVLVVDDEIELLAMNQLLLESAGYQVLIANSAKQALNTLQMNTVDILLSDIEMPVSNGFVLAKAVAAQYPHVQIQLVSGYADETLVDDDRSAKWFEQRLKKPIAMNLLLSTLARLMAQSRENPSVELNLSGPANTVQPREQLDE